MNARKPIAIPVNGILHSKYDDAVFALAEESPGEWGIVQQRIIVNTSFFNGRYGRAGFEFTSRTNEKTRMVYGRYVGGDFDRSAFYDSLDPHGQRFGKVAA